AFFGGVRARLKDGGLYLNHGIVHDFHWKRTSQTEFPHPPAFPNGALAGLSEKITEMERAGWEIMDVEGLRLHYARTCRHWVERLCAREDEARALAGERTYRTWRLYLTCSAVAFEGGSLGLYQVLMRKQWDPRVGYAPRTREPLYERAPACPPGPTRSIRGPSDLYHRDRCRHPDADRHLLDVDLPPSRAGPSLAVAPADRGPRVPRRAVAGDRAGSPAVGGRTPQAPHLHRQGRRSAQPLAARLLEGAALERLLLHPGSAQPGDHREVRARPRPRSVGAALLFSRLAP